MTATTRGRTTGKVLGSLGIVGTAAVIPHLGHLIQALGTPVISQALVYGAPALLAGWLLLSIWLPTTPDQTNPDQTTRPAAA